MGQHRLKKAGEHVGTAQWETEGNCEDCKKRPYCSIVCSKAQEKADSTLRSEIAQIISRSLSDISQKEDQ